MVQNVAFYAESRRSLDRAPENVRPTSTKHKPLNDVPAGQRGELMLEMAEVEVRHPLPCYLQYTPIHPLPE